jgi:uncharacterized circularly permuted ATP-grasp superfamily protein
VEPAQYELEPGAYDEAFEPGGQVRPHYEQLVESLEEADLEDLRTDVQAEIDGRGATFGEDQPFLVDPVPRLITAAEWEPLAAGLVQRTRALRDFAADVYTDQRIFAAGIVPERFLDGCDDFDPQLRGISYRDGRGPVIAGMDLVREPDGGFSLLEDNVRMPSGAVYAMAAREVIEARVDAGATPLCLGGYIDAVLQALRDAAPGGGGEPSIAVLSDSPENVAWYEHRRFAELLGVPLVTPDALRSEAGRLYADLDGRRRQIDVLYRRLNDECLHHRDGRPAPLGELLLPALRAGNLTCVNPFGNGVTDDKLTHAYAEEMIRFYLGEEPLLRSLPPLDLGVEGNLEQVRPRWDDYVIKPRGGLGGKGVVILGRVPPEERQEAIDDVLRSPADYIAQETVPLSTHPTICAGSLEPRRVDLRPFTVVSETVGEVMPGGLTRFAREREEWVVNSSQGGGAKDTWVLGA